MGVKVKLGTFHLWKSTNYSLFPRIVARAERERLYTVKEIREELFLSDQKTTNKKDFKRHILWENIWDVEKEDNQTIRVRGLPFFQEKEPSKYLLTDIGKKLAELYREGSEAWKIYLAEIVLKFDPRLRILIYLMSKHGCLLMRKPSYSLASKEIHFQDILNKNASQNMNFLLKKYADEAIGPFILRRVGLEDEGISTVEGVKHPNTSMDKKTLTSTLRSEFQLLSDVGVALDAKSHFSLVYSKTKQILDREVYYDLFVSIEAHDFLGALKMAYQNKIRFDGFVGFQDLKQDTLRLFPEVNFDYEIDQAIMHGKVKITRGMQGLRSDGEGFRGRREYQLIELTISE